MLKELSEDLISIKKIQSEAKDTLIEIKKNLQWNNRRVDEADNQPVIRHTKKQKNNPSEQQEKENNTKKMRKV